MPYQETTFFQRLEMLASNPNNKSGKSDKFYEVSVDGLIETRRWGRYGTDGQTRILPSCCAKHAIERAKKQIEAKRLKGYTDPVAPLTRLAHAIEEE